MAAGTTSVDARAVRVDSIGRGVETHKPHRTTHIGVRFWDPEPRAAPVTNGEDRKSPVQEFLRPDETKGWVRRHADRVVGVFVASELAVVGLIRFRGHRPKGGYDGQNGIKAGRETSATTVL